MPVRRHMRDGSDQSVGSCARSATTSEQRDCQRRRDQKGHASFRIRVTILLDDLAVPTSAGGGMGAKPTPKLYYRKL